MTFRYASLVRSIVASLRPGSAAPFVVHDARERPWWVATDGYQLFGLSELPATARARVRVLGRSDFYRPSSDKSAGQILEILQCAQAHLLEQGTVCRFDDLPDAAEDPRAPPRTPDGRFRLGDGPGPRSPFLKVKTRGQKHADYFDGNSVRWWPLLGKGPVLVACCAASKIIPATEEHHAVLLTLGGTRTPLLTVTSCMTVDQDFLAGESTWRMILNLKDPLDDHDACFARWHPPHEPDARKGPPARAEGKARCAP